MASDGVLDNMFDNDLKDCVLPQMDRVKFKDPQETAYCIALKSFELGSDPKYNSPFAIGARNAGRQFQGGKLDDISVVAAQIHTADETTTFQDFDSNGLGIDTWSPVYNKKEAAAPPADEHEEL